MPALLLGSTAALGQAGAGQVHESMQDRRIQDEQIQHQLEVGKHSAAVAAQESHSSMGQAKKETKVS